MCATRTCVGVPCTWGSDTESRVGAAGLCDPDLAGTHTWLAVWQSGTHTQDRRRAALSRAECMEPRPAAARQDSPAQDGGASRWPPSERLPDSTDMHLYLSGESWAPGSNTYKLQQHSFR